MNGKSAISAVVCGLAVAMMGGAAHALVFHDTYTGTVTGVDTFGYFGAAGATLNTSYTAAITGDTSKGSGETSSGATHNVEGGQTEGDSAPLTGTLTINGLTFSLGTTGFFSEAQIIYGSPAIKGRVYNEIEDASNSGVFSIQSAFHSDVYSTTTSIGFPSDFGQSYLVAVDGTIVKSYSYFNITKYDNNSGTSQKENLVLSPLVAASALPTDPGGPAGPAPEPGTWALMVIGIGAVGATLRRTRVGSRAMRLPRPEAVVSAG